MDRVTCTNNFLQIEDFAWNSLAVMYFVLWNIHLRNFVIPGIINRSLSKDSK